MTILQGSYWLILMKFFVNLPRGLPSPLTQFPALSGSSMSSKTPGRELKDKETLDMIQDVWYGVFENMDVPAKAWDGVKRLREALGSFPESFIKIKHLKPYQDSPFPLSPFLESWRTWRFLPKLDMVSGGQKNPWEALPKISSKLDNRITVKW